MKKENNLQAEIINILNTTYPDAKCSLDFDTPFHLLVAVILSAQCTDDRVNKTTPSIFAKCSTPEDFANTPINIIEDLVHPCGFYKNKAKNIKATSKILVDQYNSTIPNTMEELILLPGVGRKTANVVMLEAFNKPCGIAVDTHCKRIANRLGLSSQSDPTKIEQDLISYFDNKYLRDINHLFIWHGRNICTSQNPKCDICPLNKYCKNKIN